jgi:hypothetical protein
MLHAACLVVLYALYLRWLATGGLTPRRLRAR